MSLKKRLIYTYSIIGVLTLMGFCARLYIFPTWPASQHAIITIISFFVFGFIFETHLFINNFLNKRLPFSKNIVLRIFVQLLISVGIMKGIHSLVFPHMIKFLEVEPNQFFYAFTTAIIILVSAVINAVLIIHFFFDEWKKSLIKNERLEKEKARVQFDGLKNQLNPHFLFNSLASLNSLIKEDPPLASQYLQHLSKVYRYVLQHGEGETVTLNTEMEFIQNYIFLLKTRFENMILIDVRFTPDQSDKKIVPVTLQNMLENAMKHNSISKEHPLKITLYIENDYLVVENNLQLKKSVETSNGTGLEKLRSLYSYLDPRPVLIEREANKFSIKIPLLH